MKKKKIDLFDKKYITNLQKNQIFDKKKKNLRYDISKETHEKEKAKAP